MLPTPLPHFNSIKVRLKRPVEDGTDTLASFQFHKGTIKTVVHDVDFAFDVISIP